MATAEATAGHTFDGARAGQFPFTSRRCPYYAAGAVDRAASVRWAMTLVPFNAELNRLRLVVKGTTAASYKVAWGEESTVYPAAQLAKGINLADEFAASPFLAAFRRVEAAVAAKQTYETEHVKKAFRSQEAKTNMARVVARTEPERAPLALAIQAALVPVTHTIKIEPLAGR